MAKRPNILKLATKISLESMTYTGITYNDPEYKILEPIIDDDMCAIMMHVRLETNRTVEEVAKRARKSVEFTQEQLDKLCKTGAVRYRYVDGKRCYFYPIWVPGIMEGILANREQCDKYPVLGESFEAYTRRRPEMLAPMLDSGKTGMFFMRVMPVMSAIENDSHAASYDEVRTLIENATAISVGPCSCRRARRLMGEGCGHLEEDMCMYLNDNARCFSEQGYHRLVTKEEAYEILQRAEDNGLVHEINQTPGFEDTNAICNCCGCSCFALRIAELFRTPRAIRSNYIARVDKEKCVACGQCVENCQTNALKLGQKRCATDPHISDTYDTDASVPFHRSSYNPEYRTTRSDVMPSGTAPCKAECPAHIPVQGYIKLASLGRYTEALELIKKENPFPAVCGRICNKRCEAECTRGDVDEAVAIDEVKRFIADHDLHEATRYVPKLLNQIGRPYTEKIAVIGAGPAGMSCAYYLANKGYPVTVFDRNPVPGGMLTLGIPSFRLEKNVVNAEIDVLKELGVEFRFGIEVGKNMTLDALRADGYKAIYLAVGASKGTLAGCPGDDLKGVFTGVEFLRAVNLGKRPTIGKQVAVIGGGQSPRPGEVSLAHNGVLFLDELPEFRRDAIESMRQPLEDGQVTISRVQGSQTFPCEFMLVCAMNPCPCGWYGDPSGRCTCSQAAVDRYLSRISGPMLDRVDMIVEVSSVKFDELRSRTEAEPSSAIKARVDAARNIQNTRYSGTSTRCNAYMQPAQLRTFCQLDEDCTDLMKQAFDALGMTARSYDRVLKVARTIADLAGSDQIRPEHIAEAVQYRSFQLGGENTR